MNREDSTPEQDAVDPHAECWDLLPWLVTGRLGSADRTRVEAHVADCASCQRELAEQRQLRQRMSSAERVAYSPAASFEKLWSRIEELEREVPQAATEGVHATVRPAVHQKNKAKRHKWVRHGHASRLSRALVAAVLVQTAALVWLAISLVPRTPEDAWPFRTVTAPLLASMPANMPGGAIRVVFDRSVTLGDLQDVLAAHGLLIVQTSPASEALVLTPATNAATTDVTLILRRLRADHRVRFAEIVTGAAAP